MAKLLKKLTVFAAALCLLTTALFSAACNEDYGNPAEIGYEITVLYPDGRPVQSTDTGSARNKVNVVLTDADDKALNPESMGILDANGTAHINYKTPGEYTINVNNVPKGFLYVPEKTRADRAKQTVYLKNVETAYEINVLAPDGAPANGYNVEVEYPDREVKGITNAQGKFVTPVINAGAYGVKVSDATGKIRHKSVSTSPSGEAVTVKTFEPAVISLDNSHKMTDEQLEDWLTINGKDPGGNYIANYISELDDNYLYDVETFGGEETFYILHANKTGTYTFNLRPDTLNIGDNGNEQTGNYIVKFYLSGSYDDYNESMTLDGSENGGIKNRPLSMTEGEDWIFSVSSRDKRAHYKTNMAISFRKEPLKQSVTDVGDYTLTFNDNNEAVLEFTPKKSGKYEISLNGTHANNPKYIAYSYATNKPLKDIDSNKTLYDQADEFPIKENYPDDYFAKDDKGNIDGSGSQRLVYHIFIDTETSTTVSINIKRTGNADPLNPEVTETEIPAPEGLSKQEFAEDFEEYNYKWNWLDPYGTNIPVEKDGKWVVNIDGIDHEVYFAVSKNFNGQEYSFATVEYYGAGSSRPGASEDNGSGSSSDGDSSGGLQPDRQNNKLIITVDNIAYNYRKFVEAYAKLASKAAKPNEPEQMQGESDEAYQNRLNEWLTAFNSYAEATDGVYALNADLMTLAKRFMDTQWINVDPDANPQNKPAQPWLLACGYITKTPKN